MKADYLAFRNAEKLVESYVQEWRGWAIGRADSLGDWNAEALLQLGIDAFEWLLRADHVMRQAIYAGHAEHDVEFEEALHALCKSWHETANLVDQWISQRPGAGKTEDLVRLRDYVAEMAAILEAHVLHDETLPPPMAKLRDAAIDEQRHGTTAEFI